MSNRKVVTELSKLWDAVAAKGKLTTQNRVYDVKRWVAESPTVSAFQAAVNERYDRLNKFHRDIIARKNSSDNAAETASKENLGRVEKIVSKYEEFTGINEVKKAHTRVLSSEAKFVDCQEKRRLASKELSEIYNKLLEIRSELDRTERGDETYLDLIKQEIAVTKQERVMRKLFEDLEKTEREVFAELSSALRINHEKERQQNEKTKYWSIVGSIIGAGLGVLGTTINNRIKQNHLRHILEETSSQFTAIQARVEHLAQASLTAEDVARILETARPQESDSFLQQEKLTKAMQESLKVLQQLIVTNPSYDNQELPSIAIPETPTATLAETDLQKLVVENRWQVTAAACSMIAISYLMYRFI